jgi:positive regulator of sigma E activity
MQMNTENSFFQNDYEQGTVIAADDHWVKVELVSKSVCHTCSAKMLCQPDRSGNRVLNIPNTLQAQVGDQVVIEQVGKSQLRLTAMQYGLPLMLFLGFSIGGSYLIKADSFGIPRDVLLLLLGLLGIGIGGVGTYIWCKRQVKRQFSVFRLVQILTK